MGLKLHRKCATSISLHQDVSGLLFGEGGGGGGGTPSAQRALPGGGGGGGVWGHAPPDNLVILRLIVD